MKLNIPAVKLSFLEARFRGAEALKEGFEVEEGTCAEARRRSRSSLDTEGSKADVGGRGRAAGIGGADRGSDGNGGTGGEMSRRLKVSFVGESVAPAVEGRLLTREV